MIGAHRNLRVGAALPAAAAFLAQQRAHQRHHVRRAVEVLGFIKRAVGLARDVAQMGEMNARAERLGHRDEIVVGARAQRAGAQRHPVGGACRPLRTARENPRRSRRRAAARTAKTADRPGGSPVARRPPRPTGATSLRNAMRLARMSAGGERGEFAQGLRKLLARIGGLARRHAADDVLLDRRQRLAVEALQSRARGRERGGGIIRFGPWPPQNENVVGDERRHVEAQREARRRQRILQVRPRPVDHRHEVVADGRDAGLGEVGEAVLPGVDFTPVGPHRAT